MVWYMAVFPCVLGGHCYPCVYVGERGGYSNMNQNRFEPIFSDNASPK